LECSQWLSLREKSQEQKMSIHADGRPWTAMDGHGQRMATAASCAWTLM